MAHRWKKNLPKKLFVIASLTFIVILISFFVVRPKKQIYSNDLSLYIKGSGYYLEVAQTDKDRQKGLSNRTDLCRNCGMLFVFDKSDQHSFWMKDTHISLDIIWLDASGKIVKIITNAKTDSEDIYTNDQPAKYTIELPANESLKLNLQIGDTIAIPKLDESQK